MSKVCNIANKTEKSESMASSEKNIENIYPIIYTTSSNTLKERYFMEKAILK